MLTPPVDQNLPFLMAPRPGVNVDLRQYELDKPACRILPLSAKRVLYGCGNLSIGMKSSLARTNTIGRSWDEIFAVLREYPRLQPVVALMHSPEWARVSPPGSAATETAPPQSLDDFARFAGQASRGAMAMSVDYYQIWDEPNLADAWGSLQPTSG